MQTITSRSLLSLSLVAGCGSAVEPAPAVAPPPPAQLSLVVPGQAFLGRSLAAQIVGTNTHFEGRSQVRFDDPAISAQVLAAAPNSLQLTVKVGTQARIGWHTIQVETESPSGGMREVVALPEQFQVLAPLRYERSGAPLERGGLAEISVLNLDYAVSPFATNGLTVTQGPRPLRFSVVTGSRVQWLGLVDALVPLGPLGVQLASSDPIGQPTYFATDGTDPLSPMVRARPAVELMPGQKVSGQRLAAANQTNLYVVTTAADDQILKVTYGSVGLGLQYPGPTLAIAPASGRFAEGQVLPTPSANGSDLSTLAWLPQKGPYYLSVFSGDYMGSAADHTYSLTVSVASAATASAKEPEPADGPDAPLVRLPLTTPHVLTGGAIEPASDVDYLSVTPSASGRLYVQAAGTPLSAVKVQILKADCITPVSLQRPLQQEAAVEAGVSYCVRLSGSVATEYRLLISAQP